MAGAWRIGGGDGGQLASLCLEYSKGALVLFDDPKVPDHLLSDLSMVMWGKHAQGVWLADILGHHPQTHKGAAMEQTSAKGISEGAPLSPCLPVPKFSSAL